MQMHDKRELIRVVRKSEDEFCLDPTGRQNGRGAYMCKNEQCLAKAVRSKGLERSFKQMIPQHVYESLREELSKLEQSSEV